LSDEHKKEIYRDVQFFHGALQLLKAKTTEKQQKNKQHINSH